MEDAVQVNIIPLKVWQILVLRYMIYELIYESGFKGDQQEILSMA